LREFPLLSVPLPPFMRDAMHRLLKIRPHEKIPLQLECNDLSVLKAVAAETDALLFATASSVRNELSAGTLAPVPIADSPRLALEFAIAFLAERTMSPAGEVALLLVEQTMQAANLAASETMRRL
jgi:DNA-binding transcriptional LysR family regulator